MGKFKKVLNKYTGQLQLVNDATILQFKPAVANAAALPATGNDVGDARITDDTHHLYAWDGTVWNDQGDIIDLYWSAISGKPSSSVGDIDDAVTKRHTQNTDLYLATQSGHQLYVDGNRTDSYTEVGSLTKPFKTIQAAIDAATGAAEYNRFSVLIAPGNYTEQIVMKNWVHLIATIPDSVWITSAAGDVVTTAVDANLSNISITYNGSDSSKVGLRVQNGAILVTEDVNIYANYTGIVVENGGIYICYTGGTVTGEADSVIIRNGGYIWIGGSTFSGWGAPYYDLTIEAGGRADVDGLQLYNELLNNLGTLNLLNPASRINNDSTVSGVTVKNALETLGGLSHTQNTDEYLSTPVTNTLYVDGNRVDIYTADGSITKPFKKIQDAIDAVTAPSVTNKFLVVISPGAYYSDAVTIDKGYITFRGSGFNGARITGAITLTAENQQTTFEQIRISGGLTSTASHFVINVDDCWVTGTAWTLNPTTPTGDEWLQVFGGLWYVDAVLTNINTYLMGGGYYSTFTVTEGYFTVENADINNPFAVISGGAAQVYAFGCSGQASVFTMNDTSALYIDADVEGFSTITLGLTATIHRSTKGGNISNDSSVTGTTVKDALETLDSTKYSEDTEIKIKVYSQITQPALSADSKMAIWIDTSDSNRVHLVFRRGTGDQVSVELA